MAAETTEIPDRNREMSESIDMIALAVHQISHDIHRAVDILARFAPVAEAYQRGGLLAARTARRQANGR